MHARPTRTSPRFREPQPDNSTSTTDTMNDALLHTPPSRSPSPVAKRVHVDSVEHDCDNQQSLPSPLTSTPTTPSAHSSTSPPTTPTSEDLQASNIKSTVIAAEDIPTVGKVQQDVRLALSATTADSCQTLASTTTSQLSVAIPSPANNIAEEPLTLASTHHTPDPYASSPAVPHTQASIQSAQAADESHTENANASLSTDPVARTNGSTPADTDATTTSKSSSMALPPSTTISNTSARPGPSSETVPPSTAPSNTGDLVCATADRARAERNLVETWVPVPTIERLRFFGDFKDAVAPAFSIANIPSTATWGKFHQFSDMSPFLCIDNNPITVYVAGTVHKKWFTDYLGTPQSPVKVAIQPARAIDLAAANYWMSKTEPPSPVNNDAVWASRVMVEWPDDTDVLKPEVVHFSSVFDSTNPFNSHDAEFQKTSRFFDVGDIVLLETLITRYKGKGNKTAGWKSYKVGFELQSIDVIARNPERPNAFARPTIPPRSSKI